MSNNADDQLYAWVKTTLEGVSDVSSIVGQSDKVVRDDWPLNMRGGLPRLEYNPFRFSLEEGGTVYRGQFGITVLGDRSDWFGTGDTPEAEGDIWTLEAAVIGALSNAKPTGITGYTASPIEWTARRRPTETPDDIVGRRLNFGVTLYPGSTVPLSGGDADLDGLGDNFEVVNWNISVDGSRNTDFDRADTSSFQLRLDKPIAVVSIRARLVGDGSAIFPAYNSRQSMTFYVDSDSSFTESSVLIGRVQWVPNQGNPAQAQYVNITAYIDNPESPVFTGSV